MDADEALQMFFEEEDAPTFPLRDFLTQICPRATMSSSLTTGPAILPPQTASSDEENLCAGSGQPSADGESRVRESVNLDNITSPEQVET